jgi:hypothetical protein
MVAERVSWIFRGSRKRKPAPMWVEGKIPGLVAGDKGAPPSFTRPEGWPSRAKKVSSIQRAIGPFIT